MAYLGEISLQIPPPEAPSIDSGLQDTPPSVFSISSTKKAPEFRTANKIVTFFIGEDREEFVVHQEHAVKYSPVFDKAFNSDFVEGQRKTYTIDETSASAFRILVIWLYTQKLGKIQLSDYDTMLMTDEEKQKLEHVWFEETGTLLELWVLAGRFLIPELQNEVMYHLGCIGLVGKAGITALELRINYIYENTATDSPLRRFVVHHMAWTLPHKNYKKNPECFPHDFLLDLATVFSSAVPTQTAKNKRNCQNASNFQVKVPFS